MLWYTYLYENKYCLQTNKMRHLLWKGKVLEKLGEEENRVTLIKSLITRDRNVALGVRYLRSIKIDRICELIESGWSYFQVQRVT